MESKETNVKKDFKKNKMEKEVIDEDKNILELNEDRQTEEKENEISKEEKGEVSDNLVSEAEDGDIEENDAKVGLVGSEDDEDTDQEFEEFLQGFYFMILFFT